MRKSVPCLACLCGREKAAAEIAVIACTCAPLAGGMGEGRETEAPIRTSSAGRLPAKFKHINKRRKRNQPGFPE